MGIARARSAVRSAKAATQLSYRIGRTLPVTALAAIPQKRLPTDPHPRDEEPKILAASAGVPARVRGVSNVPYCDGRERAAHPAIWDRRCGVSAYSVLELVSD
jgi:hypothetical protein